MGALGLVNAERSKNIFTYAKQSACCKEGHLATLLLPTKFGYVMKDGSQEKIGHMLMLII